MRAKKNPDVEVGRNSSLYFAIGIILMLLATKGLLEFKTYDKPHGLTDVLNLEQEYEEEIPIVNMNTPPPPPPPAAVTEVKIVEDIAAVEETIIESTETDLEEAIEEHIVRVEDIKVDEVEEDIEVPFAIIEKVPIFPGCSGNNDELKACFQEKIQEHIQNNFRFPDVAKEMGVSGKVFVLFVIDKNGNVANIKTRGPDKVLEQEAERIISTLPKMTPGRQRGKAVSVPYSIPIMFKLMDAM